MNNRQLVKRCWNWIEYNDQTMDTRIPTLASLRGDLSAWEIARVNGQKGVDWQFTTETARVKLKRLYPQFMSWQCTSKVGLKLISKKI